MRIGVVVNSIGTERAVYTSVRLAMAATNRGHETWLMGVDDLAYQPDETVCARARRVDRPHRKSEVYLRELRGPDGIRERIAVDDLDVLLLRNDPAAEPAQRAWARSAGVVFGRVVASRGVIVLNDPDGLAKAHDKLYLQQFPPQVRPRTLVTRDRDEIRHFLKDDGGPIVLKPLLGSGGTNVFLVHPDDESNLNQIIDVVSREGYVVAQEYLPAAAGGDIRLFLMNGLPLRHRGRYAAFRRLRPGNDLRSNMTVGGTVVRVEIDENVSRVAEIVRPRLVADGMFLVGLDIVDDKLMEINVFSPGGLGSAQRLEGVNFAEAVVDAIEAKVRFVDRSDQSFTNVDIATL